MNQRRGIEVDLIASYHVYEMKSGDHCCSFCVAMKLAHQRPLSFKESHLVFGSLAIGPNCRL